MTVTSSTTLNIIDPPILVVSISIHFLSISWQPCFSGCFSVFLLFCNNWFDSLYCNKYQLIAVPSL